MLDPFRWRAESRARGRADRILMGWDKTGPGPSAEGKNHIRAFPDAINDLLIELKIHGGFPCLDIANVDMGDGCPCVAGFQGAVRYLLRSDGKSRGCSVTE